MRSCWADAGIDEIDYVAIADRETLQPCETIHDDQAVALIAAHVGSTRLIDNMFL